MIRRHEKVSDSDVGDLRDSMPIARSLAVIGMCCALAVAAFGFAIWAVPLAQYDRQSRSSSEGSVSVVVRPADLAQPATARLSWSAPKDARIAGSGLVTALSMADGDALQCGHAIMEIDTSPVVLFCGDRPLSSPVSASTQGKDFEALVAFLRRMGILGTSQATPLAAQMDQAIKSFQRQVGQPVDGVVEPRDFVWLPDAAMVDKLVVAVGMTISPGDVLFSESARLLDAHVTPPAIDLPGKASWTFDLDSINVTGLKVEGDRITDFARLNGTASKLITNGILPPTADGVLRLSSPVRMAAVPPASIIVDGAKRCVIVDHIGQQLPMAVGIVGADVDVTYIISGLVGGEMVVTAPDPRRRC